MHTWRRSLRDNNNKTSSHPSPPLITSPSPASLTSPSHNHWLDSPSVVFVPFATLLTFLLAAAFVFLLCFLIDKISAAWLETHNSSGDRGRHHPCRRRWTGCGLHPVVLDSFPVITCHPGSADVEEAEECAVCLSAFREKEECRLLPVCGHVFHLACVDQWVIDHATCPLCRCDLWKTPPVPSVAAVKKPDAGQGIQIQSSSVA